MTMIAIKYCLLFGLVLVRGNDATKGKGGGYGGAMSYGGGYGGGGYGGGHGGGGHSPAQPNIILVSAPQPVFYHVPAARPAPVYVPSYGGGGYGQSHGLPTGGHASRHLGFGGSYRGHGIGQSSGYGAHTGNTPVHVHVHPSALTATYQPSAIGHYQSASIVPSYHPAPVASYEGGYGGGHSVSYDGSAAGTYIPAPIVSSYHQASVPLQGSSPAIGGY